MASGNQDNTDKWLSKLEKRFQVIAGEDGLIDLDEFKGALNAKKSFFAERFFKIIDADNSGNISLDELISALHILVNGTEQEKLLFLFQVYDADGSGFIDFDELRTVLQSCTAESALTLSDETLTELVEVLFEDADVDGDGQVSFEELSEQLQRYPEITANLSISAAEWLNPKPKKKRRSPTTTCCSYQTFRNNIPLIGFWIVYVIINGGLATWGAFEGHQSVDDAQHPAGITVARAAGRCLSFNCCFILVLMLRKLLTLLRGTFLMSILPLDQHVSIHKMVAAFTITLSTIHTVGHCANLGFLYEHESKELNVTAGEWVLEVLVRRFPGLGLVEGSCFITGALIIIVLIIMTICSMPFIRRNGYFKVFFWTHQLCIVFWILIIIHAKYFWIWFILPGVIYIIERILRLPVFRRARFGTIYIQTGYTLPANVVHLVIQRPAKFKFHAGEYMYVNIPSIASNEWHPFTISSAPEQQEFLSLHIRCCGHWTNRLLEVFKEREADQLEIVDCDEGDNFGNAMEVIAEEPFTTDMDSTPLTDLSDGKEKMKGETNLGFEPEQPDDANGSVKIEMEGNNNTNNGVASGQNGHPPKEKPPSIAPSNPDKQSPATTSTAPIRKISRGQMDRPELSRLDSREKFDMGETSQRKASRTSSVKSRRSRSSVKSNKDKRNSDATSSATRKISSALATRKISSASATRKNSALHALDLAKMLSGTPHTGMEIILDGPYGAPAQHIMDAEHAVLIGAGIGITPFASILQSIHEKYKAAMTECPKCKHTWIADTSSILKTKKVDFFWINRGQRSFEWFISLLNTIEMQQAEIETSRFLDIHLYMTSALSPSDMKAIGLHVALDLIHQKKKRDTITGLMTRTQPGRPNWDEVFTNLKKQHKGKITVFFCGAPALGKVIRSKCLKYQVGFRKENF